jgi:hypothetical protein
MVIFLIRYILYKLVKNYSLLAQSLVYPRNVNEFSPSPLLKILQ